jgi:hypothetical protein
LKRIKREIIFTTVQRWRVRVGVALHNYGEELQYSHTPQYFHSFLTKKRLIIGIVLIVQK